MRRGRGASFSSELVGIEDHLNQMNYSLLASLLSSNRADVPISGRVGSGRIRCIALGHPPRLEICVAVRV